MKSIARIALTVAVLAVTPAVFADFVPDCPPDDDACVKLSPKPRNLCDLDHYYYYTWGMERPWELGDYASSARLTFKNIRNWKREPNVLYVHLLDDAPLGVRKDYDRQQSGDAFDGQGVLLETYVDLPTSPQTLVYEFTDSDLAALNDFAADGRLALAFDPDCHFWNDGITLEICRTPIPEPSVLGLLTCGGLGLLRRFRRR